MASLEEVLEKETYKQVGLDVGQRVFYTLTGEADNPHREKLQANLNSKAIALLCKLLNENGPLTDHRLDELLLDLVR